MKLFRLQSRIVAVAIIVNGISSSSSTAQTPKSSERLPVIPALSSKAVEPEINGAPDDPVWNDAVVLPLDGWCDQARRDKGEKPADKAEVRLFTGKDYLYVAFSCQESHPDGPWLFDAIPAPNKKRNYQVLAGDYCAIVLDMGRFGFYNNYFIAVSPKGDVYCCYTWPQRYDLVIRDTALPEVSGAAKIDANGKNWSAELKIPLKDLLRYPDEGLPRRLGLDLRRVQWGTDRGKQKFSVYWTGMAQVEGRAQNLQYSHMATWKPLFPKFPSYPSSYACGDGWTQLAMPEWFNGIELAAGTIDNQMIEGQGAKLIGHISARLGWDASQRAKIVKELDAPRMEQWDDLRPQHPEGKPEIVLPSPETTTKVTARFATPPTVTSANGKSLITFTAATVTDCTVAIIDDKGKIVRHLAAGMLGPRAPEPLKTDSLSQELAWDHKDNNGKPVAPGQYRVTISLGLKPEFDHAIALEKKWVDADKWPGGLDIENVPNPPDVSKAWPPNHSGYAYGSINYLSVDRQREELYLQTRYVHDGVTGKFLRELKLNAPAGAPFNVSWSPGNGEISVGPDEALYLTGANEVWRFSREGEPLPFASVGRNFIPELWGAHSNPHRGIAVAADGTIYKMHHYVPHTNARNQLTAINSDGHIRSYGFIEFHCPVAGVKVDRKGNLYVGAAVQPPDTMPPRHLAEKLPEELRAKYPRLYGSIIKFSPAGGIVRAAPQGELVLSQAKGINPYTAQGAIWVRPGVAPLLSRIADKSGGPGCNCRNGRFDLDDFGRIFMPDAISGRVEVLDSNGNTLTSFGARGKPDAYGTEFGWATQVAVSDQACYVSDYLRMRVVRAKLTYDAQEQLPVNITP